MILKMKEWRLDGEGGKGLRSCKTGTDHCGRRASDQELCCLSVLQKIEQSVPKKWVDNKWESSTLKRCLVGLGVRSASAVANERLTQLHCTAILVSHHPNKAGLEAPGSSDRPGAFEVRDLAKAHIARGA